MSENQNEMLHSDKTLLRNEHLLCYCHEPSVFPKTAEQKGLLIFWLQACEAQVFLLREKIERTCKFLCCAWGFVQYFTAVNHLDLIKYLLPFSFQKYSYDHCQ